MECMLLPRNPTAPLAKVPYLGPLKYDGGEWHSFPQRQNQDWPKLDPNDSLPIYRYMLSLPNSEGLERFLQAWLFFGLLSQFFGGNAAENSTTITAAVEENPGQEAQKDVLRRIYDRYTCEESGNVYITTATLLQDMQAELIRTIPDRKQFKLACTKLVECLKVAWVVFNAVPTDFDPNIRSSIGVIGELLTQLMKYALKAYGLPEIGYTWISRYFNESHSRYDDLPSVRKTMLANGWCPSDISRSMTKFASLQMFHLLGKMDKSCPPRDHSKCNDLHCAAYQINMGYEVRHVDVDPKCECKLKSIDNQAVIGILEKEECIPLLKFVGGLDDLQIEVVQSSTDTAYVAISHVWADGLGNPKANALNACELIRLRKLVEELWRQKASAGDPPSDIPNGEMPYIWIDTLCCPVGPKEAKKMAIEKIRNVYQHARHVLVLDAGLEAYPAQGMEYAEQLARISTSGWLRRLWTLQEGALAKSLYFRFADCSIPLEFKKIEKLHSESDLRYRIIAFDFLSELVRLQSFYHSEGLGGTSSQSELYILDEALQYRSVSVQSDEPLCLACLMGMSPTPMLVKDVLENDRLEKDDRIKKEDRMKIFWTMVAEKKKGIPSKIIFLEDVRIDARGWRWAPSTLLTPTPQYLTFSARILRLKDSNMGEITPNGLKVKAKGYRILLGVVDNPWTGAARLPENNLYCRDVETNKLYMIVDKELATISKNGAEAAVEAYYASKNYAITSLVANSNCYVIEGEHKEGILASLVPPDERVKPSEILDGIPVRTGLQVIFSEASPAQIIFVNAVESLAQELREDELTRRISALELQDTAEAKDENEAILGELKNKMKEMMKKAIQDNADLGLAIDSLWGSTRREFVWVCIGDWYYHDLRVTKMPSDQIWYVD